MPRVINNGNPLKGEKRNNATFTDDQVVDLRRRVNAKEITVRKITDEFKCSKTSVIFMLLGRTYAHIPGKLETATTHPSGGGKRMSVTATFLAFHTVKIMGLSYRRAGLLLKTHPQNLPRRIKAYNPKNYPRHRLAFVKACINAGKLARLRQLNLHTVKVNSK